MLGKYTHKETWSRRGKDFLIEVVRWETINASKLLEIKAKIPSYDTGRFIWNVYCYIYPKHPLFNKPQTEDMFDCPVKSLNCGCTYARWSRDKDGEIQCKQYGSDYVHIWDEGMDKIENPEYAYRVFNDAEDLFNELEGEREI